MMGISRRQAVSVPYLVVDAEDARDPVGLEALDALDVVHIVDQHDDVRSLDLAVCVLLLFPQG